VKENQNAVTIGVNGFEIRYGQGKETQENAAAM
jgi:hypothetical protein